MGVTDLNRTSVRQLSLSESATVRDVIAVIDQSGAQIALITDDDHLIGLITDGDIRRALLRGESLESDVSRIMRKEFVSLQTSATEAEALLQCAENLSIRYLLLIRAAGLPGYFC